jgi:SAM-dependent methyltransferase
MSLPDYGALTTRHSGADEQRRLNLMAEALDPYSHEVLAAAMGERAVSRALDVGAGAGTVSAWLARRYPDAEVTALDLDTRFLGSPGLTVVQADVLRWEPPQPFDLIHTRLLLVHLPRREHLLDRLVSWLVPGGTLVVEEPADFPVAGSPRPHYRAAMSAFAAALGNLLGTDLVWPRRLPQPLQARGMVDVDARVHVPVLRGRGALAGFLKLSIARAGADVLATRRVSEEDLARTVADLDDPEVFDLYLALCSAWGRSAG